MSRCRAALCIYTPLARGSREVASGSASIARHCNEQEINLALITHCLFLQFHLGLQAQWGKKTKKNGIKKPANQAP